MLVRKVIKLKVVRLHLKASSDCSEDRLDIHDGWTVNGGKRLARLCGTNLPAQPYLTDSNLAVVSFISDETGADVGFSVEYEPQVVGSNPVASSTGTRQSK